MSVANDFASFRNLGRQITLKTTERFIPNDLKERMHKAGNLVSGLCAFIEAHVFHGDVKLDNAFHDLLKAVVGDFGNSKIIITNMTKLMDSTFRLESEEEHDKIKILLQALQSKREVQIRACLKTSELQMKKLVDWQIYDTNYALRNKDKEKELHEYLKTPFLPTKSTGYACQLYTKAICDYFWRCDAKNLERACNAFDMRGMGITIYAWLTNADIPTQKTDTPEYYQMLQERLIKIGLPERAAILIRRLAEPMPAHDITSAKLFPLPLELEELKELATLLKSV